MKDIEIDNMVMIEGEKQYLTFLLKDELFGLEVSPIKEIIEYFPVTKVPMMSDFVLGVINVRGDVLPVIDLSARIDLGKNIRSKKTCIVIVEIDDDEKKMNIGIIIDAINQVIAMPNKSLEPTPEFGLKVDKRFIKNMMRIENKFIEILNLDTILMLDELSTLRDSNN